MPDTIVVNLRIPRDLLECLDRYIGSQARGTRTDINRAAIAPGEQVRWPGKVTS